MMRRVLGLIVAGGDGPLDVLATDEDAALTPFAGKYRFIDFALATALNSGIETVFVAAPRASRALHAHLARAARMVTALCRPVPLPIAGPSAAARAPRLVAALASCSRLIDAERPDVVVVLTADH